MIELRPLTPEDIAEINSWPAYADGFAQMDYALRARGWLDEFSGRPGTTIYIAESDGQAVGFSILSIAGEGDAEFRIAIHPHRLGKGVGREVTLATLRAGFMLLGLDRIHLIVRKTNPRAARLYERVGFAQRGESVHAIQGEPIEFIDMDLTRKTFIGLNHREGE